MSNFKSNDFYKTFFFFRNAISKTTCDYKVRLLYPCLIFNNKFGKFQFFVFPEILNQHFTQKEEMTMTWEKEDLWLTTHDFHFPILDSHLTCRSSSIRFPILDSHPTCRSSRIQFPILDSHPTHRKSSIQFPILDSHPTCRSRRIQFQIIDSHPTCRSSSICIIRDNQTRTKSNLNQSLNLNLQD